MEDSDLMATSGVPQQSEDEDSWLVKLEKPQVSNGVEERDQVKTPPEDSTQVYSNGNSEAATGATSSDLPAKISRDFLECSICCEIFKKPKILIPCLHTFCVLCLKEWVKMNEDDSTFPCPYCCQQVAFPENGIAGLKDNFFMESLVATLAEPNNTQHTKDPANTRHTNNKAPANTRHATNSKDPANTLHTTSKDPANTLHTEDSGIHCTNYDKGEPASSKCSKSAKSVGTSSKKVHRISKASKCPTLFTSEEQKTGKHDGVSSAKSIAPQCSKHPGEFLKLYCRSCETPICNECALFEHRDLQHNYARIEEVAAESRKLILDLTPQCQPRIQFYHQTKKVQKRMLQYLLENAEGARENVRSNGQSLIAMVEAERDRLLSCIDADVARRKKHIEAKIDRAQVSLASAKSTRESAETLARDGCDFEVVSYSPKMMQILSILAKPPFETVDFESADVTIDYSALKKKLAENSPTNKKYTLSKEQRQRSWIGPRKHAGENKKHVAKGHSNSSTSPGKETDHRKTAKSRDHTCSICLTVPAQPVYLPCRDRQGCEATFCRKCLAKHGSDRCPVCFASFVRKLVANQPEGSMNVSVSSHITLEGYEQCEVIIIDFVFADGIQDRPDQPNPGKRYRGLWYRAYLPYNTEGRGVMCLLEKAFNRRLLFTLRASRGPSDAIVCQDIELKTSPYGGPDANGYPHPGYLEQMRAQLAAKGIK
ncbi:uncharacterized protein LOC144917774 [Branchiostoma floridae x Branchiostoma belcheri]